MSDVEIERLVKGMKGSTLDEGTARDIIQTLLEWLTAKKEGRFRIGECEEELDALEQRARQFLAAEAGAEAMSPEQFEAKFREERDSTVRMVKAFFAHKNSIVVHGGNHKHIQRLEENMEKSLQDYIRTGDFWEPI